MSHMIFKNLSMFTIFDVTMIFIVLMPRPLYASFSDEGLVLRNCVHPILRIRGGARLPHSERKYRQKQAKEQIKAGIGKSVWHRVRSGKSRKTEVDEKINAIKSDMDAVKASASDLGVVMDREKFYGSQKDPPAEQSVEHLNDLEEKARNLLQTIKKEKGAAMRREHKSKTNRRKLQRSEVFFSRIPQLSTIRARAPGSGPPSGPHPSSCNPQVAALLEGPQVRER
jgi:hypothetical protein